MEKRDDFKQDIYEKILNKCPADLTQELKLDELLKPNNGYKNSLYFENLNDSEFFDATGAKPEFNLFYKRIIKSGVGTIVFGGLFLGDKKTNQKARLTLNDNTKDAYKEIVKYAHSSGSKIYLKVKSCWGRFMDIKCLSKNYKIASNYGVDPENKQRILIRASDNCCAEIVNDFARISMLASCVNADGIIIDATYSNLIGEMSMPEYNKRVFGYYSDVDDLLNKMLKIVHSHNTQIILKISIDTLFEFNNKNANRDKINRNFDKFKTFERLFGFIKRGVDGFEFIFGTRENEFLSIFNEFENELIYKSFYSDFRNYLNTNNIKNKFGEDVIIFCHDNFIDFNQASTLVKNNIVNLINVTRNIYSDTKFIKNYLNKKLSLNCIKCSNCDKISHFKNKIECTINPHLTDFNFISSDNKNQLVAIVGSGISSLICALTLISRGYKVHLFEQKNTLNPIGKLTTIFESEISLKNYFSQIENKILNYQEKGGIKIFTETKFEATNENLNTYQSIILGTGFKTKLLSITGAVQSHVHNIYEVLNNESLIARHNKIIIYAKSILSLKLAIYLCKLHKNVEIIIKDTQFIIKNKNANLLYYFWNLYQNGVNIYFNSRITKINGDNLDLNFDRNLDKNSISSLYKILSNENKQPVNTLINTDCDLLVYEPEIIPNNNLFTQIVMKQYKGEVYLIGNALENSEFEDIIKSGYFVGKNL